METMLQCMEDLYEMKHTNISIVFVLIMVSVFLVMNQKIDTVAAITKLQIQYNNAIDNAVADALNQIVDEDSLLSTSIDFATVTDSFFRYLAWNLGLEAESRKGRTLSNYVPVIVYIVQDGLYIAYQKLDEDEGSVRDEHVSEDNASDNQVVEQSKHWNVGEWNTSIDISERIPFEQRIDAYLIQYTLTDYVRVINIQTKEHMEGYYGDLIDIFPELFPSTKEEFDRDRRLVIINCLTKIMNEYIEKHNKIAKHYGITYQFSLPYIEMEEWYRTVDDISMLVLFQGYPYGNETLGYYNRMALGGARVRKVK